MALGEWEMTVTVGMAAMEEVTVGIGIKGITVRL